MGEVFAWVKNDGVHLLTDGAITAADGTLRYVRPKVEMIPRYRAALATRGSAPLLPLLAAAIHGSQCDDFEDLVKCLAGLMKATLKRALDKGSIERDSVAEAYLIGWSTREQCGQIHALLDCMNDPAQQFRLDWLATSGGAHADMDPGLDGLRLMNDLRTRAGRVGGFCQYTVVGPVDVRTRILTTWPDRIGEMLGSAGTP